MPASITSGGRDVRLCLKIEREGAMHGKPQLDNKRKVCYNTLTDCSLMRAAVMRFMARPDQSGKEIPGTMDNTNIVPTQRTTPTYQELEGFVVAAVANNVALEQAFTAYDITLALRAAHPDVEITHTDVRELVVDQAMSLGLTAEVTDFSGNEARVWSKPVDDDGTALAAQNLLGAGSSDPSALLPGILPV